MAVYAYSADLGDTRHAAASRGIITADSPRQARDQLRARGLAVHEMVEQKPGNRRGWWARYSTGRHRDKVTVLFQEMSTLLSAGIPLLEAIDTIARQHTERFAQCILLLRDHVAAGGSLAEAMALQPELFDGLCLSIVEVGENAGTLDTALARLVEFRRRSAGLKNRLASALIYPCIVTAVGLMVSVFLMTYVVPSLLNVLKQSGKQLPLATRVVESLSNVVVHGWWAILLILAVVAATAISILRSRRGRAAWHRLQLRIPLIGDLIRKQAIARMALVMATLLKSDVVFIKTVQIAQRTVTNGVLREALATCEQAVFAGRDIAAALEKTRAFPPLVVQVFATGQASGRLEEMLEDLAKDYDAQVEMASNRLTALLEPAAMIVLAVGVGFIAFATILPILEAGDVL
jgi:general secretion pathway protein F